LTVSGDIVVRRTRRLPIKGEVLVQPNDRVSPTSPVARALLPGVLQTIKLAEKLGVEARDVPSMFRLKVGDPVAKGDVVAESKGFLGMFKSTVIADFTGTIETVSEVTGNVLVREPSIPVEITAYIEGRIAEVLPAEGAIVETRCALVQGIFGVGGERTGTVRVAVASPGAVLEADLIHAEDRGKILIGGAGVTYDAIAKASEVGAAGIICGGIRDEDLIRFLGYDIGVAITGNETINLTLIATEGFGFLPMADRTYQLLHTLEGKNGSLNGATQIRAGVIRPELIVPLAADAPATLRAAEVFELKIGTPIRVIREPYFGELGTVTELPATLQVLESGTEVRVLRARLSDGREVVVPRANVEILASA
ncbi:MAG: hypothetical protein SFX74_02845, partial [Fimbriimonadaceae bacterium]|nr:hypothetical protein [Fimbriimonadaceae bacterium]